MDHSKLNLNDAWTIFERAMLVLAGTKTPSAIATYLGRDITAQNVRDWRRKHTGIPAWVLEITNRRLLELIQRLKNTHSELTTVAPAPGRGSWWHKRKTPPA